MTLKTELEPLRHLFKDRLTGSPSFSSLCMDMFHLISIYVHTGSTHKHHGHKVLLNILRDNQKRQIVPSSSPNLSILIVILSSSSSINKLHHCVLQFRIILLLVKPHEDKLCYVFPLNNVCTGLLKQLLSL